MAEKISRKKLDTIAKVLADLNSIYPGDDAFRTAFSEKIIRTTQSRNRLVVRYILCELEKHCSGSDYDFDSDSFNLEHILPQNPDADWEAFSEEEIEAMVYRLGNMTLMKSGANKDAGNANFASKKAAYATSGFTLTRKVAEDNADWTPARLAARQQWMANQATSIWRIAQLS